MQLQSGGAVPRQSVAQYEPQALALIDSDRQGLDRVALEADAHGRFATGQARDGVAGLFVANPGELVLQHVHPALRVVIEVAVDADVHADRRKEIAADRHGGVAARGGLRRDVVGGRDQDEAFGRLMGTGVVGPMLMHRCRWH